MPSCLPPLLALIVKKKVSLVPRAVVDRGKLFFLLVEGLSLLRLRELFRDDGGEDLRLFFVWAGAVAAGCFVSLSASTRGIPQG